MGVIPLRDPLAVKNAVTLKIVLPGDVLPGLRRWARDIERDIEREMSGTMTDAIAAAAAVSCFVDTIEKINAAKKS